MKGKSKKIKSVEGIVLNDSKTLAVRDFGFSNKHGEIQISDLLSYF